LRLKPWEVEAIRQEIRSLDPEAGVYLFGSRVDDAARGGDIDLLVLSRRIGDGDRTHLQHRLHQRLGDQRVDLVLAPDKHRPFVRVVLPGARPL